MSFRTAFQAMIAFVLSLIVLTLSLLPGGIPRAAATGHTTIYLPLVLTTAPNIEDRREVIRLVNIERVAAGCSAAYENPILMAATQAWSEYMVATQTTAHTSAYPGDWYEEHGWPHPIMGENIGQDSTPQGVVTLWMNSEWHRTALLACHGGSDYRYEIGVGVDTYGWTLAISDP